MNRRLFIKNSALTSAALGFGKNPAWSEVPSASAIPTTPRRAGTTAPVLQNVSETAATIFWSATSPATGWVEYGDTAALGLVARGETDGLLPFDSRVLRIRLKNLKPGRKYFYRAQTALVDFRGPYDIRRANAVAGPIY